jgi:hypothetical protein
VRCRSSPRVWPSDGFDWLLINIKHGVTWFEACAHKAGGQQESRPRLVAVLSPLYFISDELPTRIVGVIAESPVPEPATVLLLGSALILQGCGVWKRRRCRIWAPPSHQPRYFRRPRRSLAPSGGAFLPDRPATSLRPIAVAGRCRRAVQPTQRQSRLLDWIRGPRAKYHATGGEAGSRGSGTCAVDIRSDGGVLQNLDRPPPGQFLRIVDLAQIEHVPPHHAPAGDTRVLDNAPIPMLFAILPADFAAQEYDGRQLSAHWRP